MTLKIYGSLLSSPAKLVAAICYEKAVPFEFIHLDLMKGESKTPEHLTRNPWGKVPVIVSHCDQNLK
jgi:glutathione S-transferase